MTDCWYRLKINVENAIKEDYIFPTPSGDFGIWNPPADKIFNKEWLDHMKSIGVPLYNALIFYRGPNASSKDIHVDIGKTEPLRLNNYGINWCIGGTGSEMSWHKLPNQLSDDDVLWTQANTPYISWKYEEAEEIDRCHIGKQPTLVRTDLPHGIYMKEEPRWSISARTTFLDNQEWNKIVERMRSKGLLEEHND